MALDSLQELFVDEIKDLYSAEKQLLKALPKMAKAATNTELKACFKDHLQETKNQVHRLEKIFKIIGMSPKTKTCEAMMGLIEEGAEFIKEKGDPSVMDAALIVAAQKVEHYEMAGYGCVKAHAEILGLDDAVDLLQETLAEEEHADEKLNSLAVGGINQDAAFAMEMDEEPVFGGLFLSKSDLRTQRQLRRTL